MPSSSTVAAALMVPLVLGGRVQGSLFEGSCEDPGAKARIPELRGLAGPRARAIVVSTGDLLGPEPLSGFVLDGPPVVQEKLLNLLMDAEGQPVFDAVLPGRYELSSTAERLRRLTGEGVVPWTIANANLGAANVPHRVVVRSGVAVGLTGVVDPSVEPILDPAHRPRILPPAAAIDQAGEALRKAGVDVVVALVHLAPSTGPDSVIRLLEQLQNRAPAVVLTSPIRGDPSVIRLDGLGTVVVPTPESTRAATLVQLFLSPRGRLINVAVERRPVPAAPSGTADVLRNWACREIAVPVRPSTEGGSIPRAAFVGVVLERMRRLANAEVALLSPHSLGPAEAFPLPANPTQLDIRRALPFDGVLEVATVRGEALLALEAMARDSGVFSSGLGAERVAGRIRDPQRAYRVVSVDFLADGGGGYIDPLQFNFRPLVPTTSLRQVVLRSLKARSLADFVGSDGRARVIEPALMDFFVSLGANIKTVSVENRSGAESPQLSRANFLGISGELSLRLALDLPKHRFELTERTRYGIVREASEPGAEPATRENEDLTEVELLYFGRLSEGLSNPWLPNGSASVQLETELTVPDDRGYRRVLLETGVGPIWQLTQNLTLRSQLGVRRELLASGRSSDPAEAALAEVKVALLSTVELRNEVLAAGRERPVTLDVKVSHTADLSGLLRDQVLDARLSVNVPIIPGVALTAAVEAYSLSRRGRDGTSASGGAVDTSFGVQTATDFSGAVY